MSRRQSHHNGTTCGGRPIRVQPYGGSLRGLLRQHLREEGKRMNALAGPWQCKPQNVYDIFWSKRPISPNHVEAAAKFLCLDEFDTNELRLAGAREAGWRIDTKMLLETDHG